MTGAQWLRDGSAHLHDDLDRVVAPVSGIADGSRDFGERESVRVDDLCVEAPLRHQRRRAVRCAPALAADAEDIDVVAHEMGEIDRHRLGREGGETYAAATV